MNAQGERHFEHVGMVVDRYHFGAKHKITDAHCRKNCDPAMFPDLKDSSGAPRFATSMGETTNAWFVKHDTIVRGMQSDRAQFYIDEVIRLKNEAIKRLCERRGYQPRNTELAILRAPCVCATCLQLRADAVDPSTRWLGS